MAARRQVKPVSAGAVSKEHAVALGIQGDEGCGGPAYPAFDGEILEFQIGVAAHVDGRSCAAEQKSLPNFAVGGSQLNSFYGLIDELSIYSRALTPAEIQSICNSASGGKCSPPFSFLAQPANTTGYVGSSIIPGRGARNSALWLPMEFRLHQYFWSDQQPTHPDQFAILPSRLLRRDCHNSVGSMIASSNAVLAVASCLPLPENSVSWWPGDGNTLDLISGYNGTVTGSVSYAPRRSGPGIFARWPRSGH